MGVNQFSSWLEKHAPSTVIGGEVCANCHRNVYATALFPEASVRCLGCGDAQKDCLCPPVMEMA